MKLSNLRCGAFPITGKKLGVIRFPHNFFLVFLFAVERRRGKHRSSDIAKSVTVWKKNNFFFSNLQQQKGRARGAREKYPTSSAAPNPSSSRGPRAPETHNTGTCRFGDKRKANQRPPFRSRGRRAALRGASSNRTRGRGAAA